MCRSIKVLRRAGEVVTPEELNSAALQFIRKISGFHKPSKANQSSFEAAVDRIAAVASEFLESLETSSPPRNREIEMIKAKSRAAARFR